MALLLPRLRLEARQTGIPFSRTRPLSASTNPALSRVSLGQVHRLGPLAPLQARPANMRLPPPAPAAATHLPND